MTEQNFVNLFQNKTASLKYLNFQEFQSLLKETVVFPLNLQILIFFGYHF